jgi:hypothetical protein
MNELMQEERVSTADLAGRQDMAARNDMARNDMKEDQGPLLTPDFVQDLRTKWDRIQTSFVDEPRAAVQQADELVASAIKRLTESFADTRSNLERQWDRGEDINTEDLRMALRRYRSFFQKLMTV